MKKKPERYSFKKLATFAKKPELKYLEQLKSSYEKSIRSHSKNKSSERVVAAYDPSNRFKLTKNSSQHPNQRPRVRTEADQFASTKPPFHKTGNAKRDERSSRGKSGERSRQLPQGKNLNLKKLNLGGQLYDAVRTGSHQKAETPHSGKNYSFRKAHESHRSGLKKTALQKYVSESLENLELNNKKKLISSSKQNELKSTLKKSQPEQPPKAQRSSRERVEGLKEEVTPKHGRGEGIREEREDSLEKIELRWQRKRKNPYDMSKQQMQTFGDRFPQGFEKIRLLGRGGFSLVWMGQHKKSKKKYAIKQIITESSHQTHIKEIWFGTYFFEFGGAPKQEFANSQGIKHLVKLYYYFINKKDTWILYEKCGDSLGNALYELKSELFNSEKVYRIHYRQFYTRIRQNQNELRRIILHVARALQLLSENSIVHSDLKTENILVRLKTEEEMAADPGASHIQETKLIDYGSSFVFNNLRQFSMATPEYMAPEILNFILYENEFEYIPKLLEYVQKYNSPWVIDVWSLGSVLLQIVSGVPLWMSLKTIVKRRGQEVIRCGLFAIKGRAFDKIIKQQLEVVQHLEQYLYEQNYSGIVLEEDLKVLLKKMLALNPAKRISPAEIVSQLQETLGEV